MINEKVNGLLEMPGENTDLNGSLKDKTIVKGGKKPPPTNLKNFLAGSLF